MPHLQLTFVSLQVSKLLRLEGSLDNWAPLFSALNQEIVKNETSPISYRFQQNSSVFREQLAKVSKQHFEDLPQIKQVIAFFRKMTDGQYIIIYPDRIVDTAIFIDLQFKLAKYHHLKGIEIKFPLENLELKLLLKIYNISIFGHQKKTIGNKDILTRNCRFCHTTNGKINEYGREVTFKNKAHAYSHALGNQQVLLLEECDNCNNRFSMEIEPSIVTFFKLFRAIYDLPGKHGSKKLIGENFKISHLDDSINMELYEEFTHSEDFKSLVTELTMRESYIPQNVYRSLCKFILSVVESEDISVFKKTIDWINGKFDSALLPKVAILQDQNSISKQSRLLYYKRKVSDLSYPFLIGEFQYAGITLLFIIPYSKEDKSNFLHKLDYEKFWKNFNLVRRDNSWFFQEFLSMEPVKIVVNLEIG